MNRNKIELIHIYNQNDTYHLTKRILQPCALTHPVHCFFSRILTMDPQIFNRTYENLCAYMKIINESEVEVYLNVCPHALKYVIMFISGEDIDDISQKDALDVIHLANQFSIPNLVQEMRHFYPSNEYTSQVFDLLMNMIKSLVCHYYGDHFGLIVDAFFKANRAAIIDTIIIPFYRMK